MNWSELITDEYERNARLYPALLAIAPLLVLGFAVLSEPLYGFGSLGVIVLGSGGAVLLAQVGRDLGKAGEKTLYSLWGGMPSVAIFRHSDTRLDPITKAKYHNQLAGILNTKSPTPQEELIDTSGSDGIYSAWSNHLRTNTRDKNFTLLLKENISYGYRRNVWGLRPVGIVASASSILICVAQIYLVYQSSGGLDASAYTTGAFSLVMLILWIFYVTPEWVRIPADAYAQRLAETLEVLHPNKYSAKIE